MKWIIYCHTFIDPVCVFQRRYIGLTSQTMEKRWKTHVSHAKTSKGGRWHFPNAIRKYGKEAFSHRVLEICETLEEANFAEAKWIIYYNTRNSNFGFNLARGGSHIPHPVKKSHGENPEYKKQASDRSKKLWADSVFRQKHAIIMKIALSTKTYKEKQSQKQKARASTPEGRSHLLRIAHPGKILTQNHKDRISVNNAMKNPEVLEKLSISSKKAWKTPEIRTKMLNAFLKRGLISEETKSKISSAGTGRVLSKETRNKISERMTKTLCKYGHSLHDAIITKDRKYLHRRCRTCMDLRKR